MPDAVKTWADMLADEKAKPYFQSIMHFLVEEEKAGKVIYPAQNDLFSAFQETPFDQVKVVILGQDPYHGPGQAHGLSFSVQPGIKIPPSLKNIYQELYSDLNIPIPTHGCLLNWASQGVLLLNTSLSVEQGKPQSHAKVGWTRFTDKVIETLNHHEQPLVFMLWGAHAKNKRELITEQKHLILTAPHPSPFSVYQGFYGCRHFSQANAFLTKNGREAVRWELD